MNLINQHIRKCLLHFKEYEDAVFKEIVELIQSREKEKHNLLLRYIHLLLNETFLEENNDAKTLHLHFESDFDDDSLFVIAQYLLIRFFKKSSSSDKLFSQNNESLELIKTKLSIESRKISTCPDGASGKNGGNRIYKNWIKNKSDIKTLVDFYKELNDGVEIYINAIFNCQIRLSNDIKDLLAIRPYACKIEDYSTLPTYNLLNTKLTLNQIDEIDNRIIDN